MRMINGALSPFLEMSTEKYFVCFELGKTLDITDKVQTIHMAG